MLSSALQNDEFNQWQIRNEPLERSTHICHKSIMARCFLIKMNFS